MTQPLTAIHHTASTLNNLIRKRNWKLAYEAADVLDIVIARESGVEPCIVHTQCKVVDLAEERFKRVKF